MKSMFLSIFDYSRDSNFIAQANFEKGRKFALENLISFQTIQFSSILAQVCLYLFSVQLRFSPYISVTIKPSAELMNC